MIHKSLIKPKSELTTVTENTTIAEVNELFNSPNEAHTRTMPILDESGKLFRGNVYKQHVYEHIAKKGDINLPVTAIMRNSTKFIYTTSQFYEVFFAIRDLPFIAVLDENHYFTGIFTHDVLMDLLSQSWSVHTGGVAVSVTSHNSQGDLKVISGIISRYAYIESVLSLQSKDGTVSLMFTLPIDIENPQLDKIVSHLEKKHFKVTSIEDLQRFN
ncbi:cyclic di-AMP binding protein CbpA [Leuconostoc palmae]|uniref:cyclic di-AMP binding protein CbpA n=1 Tax=Leuconostoc palmae TaxID=501487 RepID=UPI001C7D49C7|nr:cyclic di-AMP binding protein CbpA [Leuconostoc palmae]